jgi:pimeloyl-ACP methyl ester carboxylesterase
MAAELATETAISSFDGATIACHSYGGGEGVLIIGGALRTAVDYSQLARTLARFFAVHVIDRRGRGRSAEQGGDYDINVECQDLISAQRATGARFAFGHSYGGLVCLETALRTSVFDAIAVYEPGVSINGCIRADWIDGSRALLERGDDWGAMVCMVQGAGFAPGAISQAPPWLARLLLRGGIGPGEWRRLRPLLRAQIAEMDEVARLDSDGERYGGVDCPTLLMGGRKSPPKITLGALTVLERIMPRSELALIAGAGHTGPDRDAPAQVAQRLREFFLGLPSR